MSNSMEGVHMDKGKEQPDPIAESLRKIAEIRKLALERDPNFNQDIAREIAEREAANLASRPASTPAEKKPARKIPHGARKHDFHQRRMLGKDFE